MGRIKIQSCIQSVLNQLLRQSYIFLFNIKNSKESEISSEFRQISLIFSYFIPVSKFTFLVGPMYIWPPLIYYQGVSTSKTIQIGQNMFPVLFWLRGQLAIVSSLLEETFFIINKEAASALNLKCFYTQADTVCDTSVFGMWRFF